MHSDSQPASDHPPRIVIFGAGSVGCYIGGRLLSAGADVVMIGRPRLRQLFDQQPLIVTDYQGFRFETALPPELYTEDASAAAGAGLVLVTVKSAATEEAASTLARHLQPGTPVISLQNGISNSELLQKLLPDMQVCAGMVPFNVLQKHPGHFHQGTEGQLIAGAHPALSPFLRYFLECGLPLELRKDMSRVLWSKLLLNLNNPINALSSVPLLEQLGNRHYRRCLAMAQSETLTLMALAGIEPISLTQVPMRFLPLIMCLPDWAFTRLARKMLAIDPVARSSMWEDLEAGRATEVDWINGEVVRLAASLGRDAPVNRRLTELVHQCEQNRRPWSGHELLEQLRRARRND